MTRVNSSGLISSNGANTEVNATLTQTSIGPSSRSTRSAAASTASASATSTAIGRAVPPARSTSSGRAVQPCSPRASRATDAPCWPKPTAVARPIPPLAPVTTTVLPLKVFMACSSSCLG